MTTTPARPSRPRALRGLRLPAASLGPLYAVLAIAPVALAAFAATGTGVPLLEVGAATGLTAVALLALQFFSSGRWALLSARAGIDRTMRFHQLAAYSVAAVVLAHPLAYVAPWQAASVAEAWQGFASMLALPALRSGAVAWVVVLALVVAGALRNRLPMRYELWRGLHAAGAAVAMAAAAHHALAVGSYSGNAAVAGILVALAALALASLAVVYLVKPWWLRRRPYRLTANRRLGPGVQELVLAARGAHALDYRAGQFAWISFGGFPWPWRDHPFSFASCPASDAELRLLVKARGDFSGCAGELALGTTAYVDGPHGNFTLEGRQGDAIVLVAGGIGIAPILGLLRELAHARDPRPVSLVYGARLPSLVVCRDEIEALKERLDLATRYFAEEDAPGWSGERGAIRLDELAGALRGAPPARSLCFVCGPPSMMQAVERRLRALGVPEAQIVAERFDYD